MGLTLSEINFRQGLVKVTGKGNKERLAPVGEEALNLLQTFIEQRRLDILDDKKLMLYSQLIVEEG